VHSAEKEMLRRAFFLQAIFLNYRTLYVIILRNPRGRILHILFSYLSPLE